MAIKEVTKFVCADGTMFDTIQDAKAHEYRNEMLHYVFSQVSCDPDEMRDIIEALETRYTIKLKEFERDH